MHESWKCEAKKFMENQKITRATVNTPLKIQQWDIKLEH